MFDVSSAVNESLGLEELQIQHVAHIAAQITNVESETWVVAVDITILILTTIGALIILGNTIRNELKGRGSTIRMRLVQSLIVSDLIMGIVGLVGCIQQLSGHPLEKDTVECDGLGVTFVAVVFSQHLWTLALAFATFMILLHPLNNVTILLEKYWYWSWLFVWAISFAVSVVGYVLYGYGPTGGICYYQDDSGLFGELIQFLPRGVVFVVIALLYGKLYVFLKRPDKIRTGYSNDSGSSWTKGGGSGWLGSRRRRIFTKHTKTVIVNDNHSSLTGASSACSGKTASMPRRGDSRSAPPDSHRHSHHHFGHLPHLHIPHPHLLHRKPAHPVEDDDIPPWERVELPPFQVDGQRYGDQHQHRQGSLLGLIRRPNSTLPNFPSHHRAFSPPTLLSPTNTLHEENESAHEAEPESQAASTVPITEEPHNVGVERHISGTSEGTTAVDADSPSRRTFEPQPQPPAQPLAQPKAAVEPPIASSEHSSPGTLAQEASSSEILCPKPMLLPNPENSMLDLEKGLVPVRSPEETDEDDDLDLLGMLRSEAVARPAASHHSSEYIQESMSSYLNRKTALLMLWFPLGYVLLFGVSTVRIIYDFVGNPPTGVRAMSRWMIFGQGLLNLVIYGAVEFHTKRVVRRRVRRGTLNQPVSGGRGSGLGSGIPGLNVNGFRWTGRRSNTAQSQTHSRGSLQLGTGSRTDSRTGNKSPTVSIIDPEKSILQRLDEEQDLTPPK